MPIVESPSWGQQPSMTLLGGSNAGLATPSTPFIPATGRSVTMIGGGLRTVSYATIYRTQPWVGTAVRRIAEAIARLPLQTFKFLDPEGDTRERDRGHPATRLLNRPRPRRRGFHLRWDIALGLYVHGNFVAWKRRPRPGMPPAELWTLDWRLLIPLMVGDRVYAWQWLGDGIPGLQRGETILVENTLHIAFNAPGGGELGVSPLEQLGVTIRSEDALQRYAESSMRHGTRFGMAAILDPKAKADKVVRDGVREELMDAHGGVDNAFRPAILGGGVVDLKPLAEQSAAEAELIAQRKVNREEIAAVVGIPGAVAGILDEAKYSSLKELHRLFYVTALGGPLGLVGESVQAQLFDDEPAWSEDGPDANLAGRFVAFSLDKVLEGDAKERWETYAVALDHGGLTLNDVRRKENLKPYSDPRADEPLIAANNVRPLSNVGEDAGTRAGRRATDPAARSAFVEVAEAHVERAFERAARGAGAGELPTDALDRERVARELGADLEELELANANALGAVVALELELALEGAKTVEDVRAAQAAHPFTGGDPT